MNAQHFCGWTLTLLAVFSTTTWADEKPGPRRGLADLLDQDQDGAVSDREAQQAAANFLREANAARPNDRGRRILEALDQDQDGKVNPQEAMQGVAQARRQDGGAGERIAGMFDKLDVDGNKLVTPAEFSGLVELMGPWGKFMQRGLPAMFNKFDANRDGLIAEAEALMAAEAFDRQAQGRDEQRAAREAQPDPRLVAIVRQAMRLDANGDGISEREASKDRQLKAVFGQVDGDLNGKLSAEELYNYLKAQQAARQGAEQNPQGGRDFRRPR